MHIVLIPTLLHIDDAFKLAEKLDNIKDGPDEIYIIDNSESCSLPYNLNNTKIYVYDYLRNIGVNASWNFGMYIAKKQNADITILNDDILIKDDFFTRIKSCLKNYPCTPVFCPATTFNLNSFKNISYDGINNKVIPRVVPMVGKEGWAFTIRSDILKEIREIPKELFTFCGDKWIWYETRIRLKYNLWGRDIHNVIYHKVGNTLSMKNEIRKTLKREKRLFNKIIENEGLCNVGDLRFI